MPLCVLFIKGAVELQLELSLTVLKICKIKKKNSFLTIQAAATEKGHGSVLLGIESRTLCVLGQ